MRPPKGEKPTAIAAFTDAGGFATSQTGLGHIPEETQEIQLFCDQHPKQSIAWFHRDAMHRAGWGYRLSKGLLHLDEERDDAQTFGVAIADRKRRYTVRDRGGQKEIHWSWRFECPRCVKAGTSRPVVMTDQTMRKLFDALDARGITCVSLGALGRVLS